ncbi:MAG: hypothetical protein U0002_15855 [Thermoanaerobaculia bacterium]
MARIPGITRGGSIVTRIAFFFSRKRVGKVVAPLRIHALSQPVLYGYGQMELALEKARRVPAGLKQLAQIRAAGKIGCPF